LAAGEIKSQHSGEVIKVVETSSSQGLPLLKREPQKKEAGAEAEEGELLEATTESKRAGVDPTEVLKARENLRDLKAEEGMCPRLKEDLPRAHRRWCSSATSTTL
jgi:hypothetical protein